MVCSQDKMTTYLRKFRQCDFWLDRHDNTSIIAQPTVMLNAIDTFGRKPSFEATGVGLSMANHPSMNPFAPYWACEA
jgi:hypothetical protein